MLWKQKLNFDNLKKIKEDRAARRRGKQEAIEKEKHEEKNDTIKMKKEKDYNTQIQQFLHPQVDQAISLSVNDIVFKTPVGPKFQEKQPQYFKSGKAEEKNFKLKENPMFLKDNVVPRTVIGN